MMTDRRCGFYLMETTLGDSTLITQENFADTFKQVESTIEARATAKVETEWSRRLLEAEQRHNEEIAIAARTSGDALIAANAAALEASLRAAESAKAAAEASRQRDEQRVTTRNREDDLINSAMSRARASGVQARNVVLLMIVIVSVGSALFGSDRLLPNVANASLIWQIVGVVVVPSAITALGFWTGAFDWLQWKVTERRFVRLLQDVGRQELLSQYVCDYKTGTCKRRAS
jgi:hypothetical protein